MKLSELKAFGLTARKVQAEMKAKPTISAACTDTELNVAVAEHCAGWRWVVFDPKKHQPTRWLVSPAERKGYKLCKDFTGEVGSCSTPAYATSVDACLTLLQAKTEEGFTWQLHAHSYIPGVLKSQPQGDGYSFSCELVPNKPGGKIWKAGWIATPARAICLALLQSAGVEIAP